MSVRTDVINLRVNINGNTALNDLNDLKKKSKDLAFELKGMTKGTAEYIAKSKELGVVSTDIDKLKQKIGLAALSQKELYAELRKLKALQGSVTPLSKEYENLGIEIKKVENRIKEVKLNASGFDTFVSKIKDGAKSFGLLTAGFIGFSVITQQIKNIIGNTAALSDSLADIQRVTGLTAKEVNDLNNSLNELDTRTSAQGLRDIALIAGKLGVAKGDILGFTKAVDQLVVSLGDELGDADTITTTLGKILNVFDGKVTGDNITRLGNAFVELANAGVASAGFIADFDQRLSGIAVSAKIGLGELSGLGGGLEELGARVESSSTAVQKLLITIAQDLPAAAKIAGKSTKEFAELYSRDATEALLQYSEGLVKNKNSFAAVTVGLKDAGEEGARTIETITKLGNNADFLRGKIDLGAESLKGSAAITEAFRLKNETLGASLDKLGKQFTRLVTDSGLANFFKGLVQSVVSLLTPTKELTEQFRQQKEVVAKLEKDTVPLIDRYEELKNKSVLNKDEQIELNKAIVAIANTIPGAVLEFDKYGNALSINAAKAREFIALQRSILKEKNRDSIKDQQGTLRELQREEKTYQQLLESGTRKAKTATGATIQYFNEVNAFNVNRLKAVQERIRGIQGIISELRGDNLETPVITPPVTLETNTDTGTGTGTKKTKKDDSAAKEFARLKAEAEKFYKEIQNLRKRTEAGEDPEAQEVERAKQKYDALLARAKEYFVKHAIDRKRFNEEGVIIEEAQRKELDEIFQKYYKKRFEEQGKEEYEASLLARQEFADDLKVQVAKEYAEGKKSKKQYEAALKQIERDETADRIIIAQDYSATVKKAASDLVRFRKEAEKQTTKDTIEEIEARKAYADKEALAQARRAVLTTRAGTPANRDARQNEVIERYKQELSALEEYSEQYQTKYQELQDELKVIDDEHLKEKAAKWLAWAKFGIDVLSGLNTILNNIETRSFNKEKARNDARKKEFKKQLDDKLLSQEQYDKKVAALQEQQDARERAIKRRQAKREKALNLMSALVNTASAVVEALPNIPLSIAVGALGLLQVGAIATTPLPELGRGGFLDKGPSHSDSDKGLHVVNPRTGRTEMLVEKDEAVLNKRAMRSSRHMTLSGTPRQIASTLNSSHGGVSFASSATWLTAPAPRIRPGMARIMAGGGIIGDAGSGDTTAADLQVTLEGLMSVQQEIAGLRQDFATGSIKAKVVYKEIKASADAYDSARKAASIRP